MNNNPQEPQFGHIADPIAEWDPAMSKLVGDLFGHFQDFQSRKHGEAIKAGIARRKARLQLEKESGDVQIARDAAIAGRRRPADE
ncbi:MAG TPA: hypothetical protein VNT53_00700 [Pseudolysinimonas sp.]|nr:hypothetical protein [Pseudolysinimonas sp.]